MKTILLNDSHSLSLLKAATQSGHIELFKPTTKSEIRQMAATIDCIRSSKLEEAALTYSLLADDVFLDGSNIGWNVYEDVDAEETFTFHHLIGKMSPEAESFVKLTDSSRNFLPVITKLQNPEHTALTLATLEPMIWRSFVRRGSNFSRGELRAALDIIALYPELLPLYGADREAEFDQLVVEGLHTILPELSRRRDVQKRLNWLCSLTIVKGSVAANEVTEAERLNALYPIENLEFGSDRRGFRHDRFREIQSEQLIAATRVFLREVRYWPVLQGFDEVIKLRGEPDFKTFREHMRAWTDAITHGDATAEAKLRKEIACVNASLAKAAKCTEIGGVLTYVGLPLIIIDALTQLPIGSSLSVFGFALQAYSDWVKSANHWMIIGRL
ncbi:MAG: hypothetical protein QOI04_182 [Verrucomicrobiota bacterium]|jgi:hypothetical protein